MTATTLPSDTVIDIRDVVRVSAVNALVGFGSGVLETLQAQASGEERERLLRTLDRFNEYGDRAVAAAMPAADRDAAQETVTVAALFDVATDVSAHVFIGACPDTTDWSARDPECPACRVLLSSVDTTAAADPLRRGLAMAERICLGFLERSRNGDADMQEVMQTIRLAMTDGDVRRQYAEMSVRHDRAEADDEGTELPAAWKDIYCEQVVGRVRHDGRLAIGQIQRRLHIGYNRAARICEELERAAVIVKHAGGTFVAGSAGRPLSNAEATPA